VMSSQYAHDRTWSVLLSRRAKNKDKERTVIAHVGHGKSTLTGTHAAPFSSFFLRLLTLLLFAYHHHKILYFNSQLCRRFQPSISTVSKSRRSCFTHSGRDSGWSVLLASSVVVLTCHQQPGVSKEQKGLAAAQKNRMCAPSCPGLQSLLRGRGYWP
jgi:hypothetical protein